MTEAIVPFSLDLVLPARLPAARRGGDVRLRRGNGWRSVLRCGGLSPGHAALTPAVAVRAQKNASLVSYLGGDWKWPWLGGGGLSL